MRDSLITLVVGAALMFAAFYVGQKYERAAVKEAVNKEITTQGKTDAKVLKYDAAALCAALGGRLSYNGECK